VSNPRGVVSAGDGVWSWGINDYCQCGHTTKELAVHEPTKIPEMEGHRVLLLAAGFFHSMCVISNYMKSDQEKVSAIPPPFVFCRIPLFSLFSPETLGLTFCCS